MELELKVAYKTDIEQQNERINNLEKKTTEHLRKRRETGNYGYPAGHGPEYGGK